MSRHRSLLRAALALALLAAWATAARAEEGNEKEARQHHDRALDLISQRRFVDALTELEAGYRLQKVSSFLYNMGRAAAEQGALENDPARAAAFRRRALLEWRAYLHVRPDAPEHSELSARMAFLQHQVDEYDRSQVERRVREAGGDAAAAERFERGAEMERLRGDLRELHAMMSAERARYDGEILTLRKTLDALSKTDDEDRAREREEVAMVRQELARMKAAAEVDRVQREVLDRDLRRLTDENAALERKLDQTGKAYGQERSARGSIMRKVGIGLLAFGSGSAAAGAGVLGHAIATAPANDMAHSWNLDGAIDHSGDQKGIGAGLLSGGAVAGIVGALLLYLAP